MKTYAKYLAGAAALAAAGFLLAVGLMSVLFKAKVGAFAPSTSADAAAWIGAIGSVFAIAASYWLGESQGRRAREHALELYHLQRRRTEESCRGVISQLYGEVYSIEHSSKEMDYASFVDMWNVYLVNCSKAALDAFDHMALHELGSDDRVRTGFEMRALLVHLGMRVAEVIAVDETNRSRLPQDQQAKHRENIESTKIAAIRRLAEEARIRQKGHHDAFLQTYTL
ncbi:hypothetical protein ACOTEE_27740 [Achromobacter xylosoxidans]